MVDRNRHEKQLVLIGCGLLEYVVWKVFQLELAAPTRAATNHEAAGVEINDVDPFDVKIALRFTSARLHCVNTPFILIITIVTGLNGISRIPPWLIEQLLLLLEMFYLVGYPN